MDKDAWIRELRVWFTQMDIEERPRLNELRLSPSLDVFERPVTFAAMLSQRRAWRNFRRRLFGHRSFHRLLEIMGVPDAFRFSWDLWMLKSVLSKVTAEDAKQWRQESARAKTEAVTAARILRDHAQRFAPKADRQALMNAAKSIEERPWYAFDDARGIALHIPFDLFGQKGDLRAYAIRAMDRCVPPGIVERSAMIRDFLELIGIDATSALVRSTLLNGRT